jgi:polyphosphate kinase
MGSADLMPRNLDHRLEGVVPVEDARAQQRLSGVFDALLADNTQAWELGSDGTWTRLRPKKDERPKPAQATLMRNTRARFRRRATPSRRDR